MSIREKFMQKWRMFFRHQSIRTRLIAWFLLIALVPIIWTTGIAYVMCKRILLDQATRHMQVLVKRQEKLLQSYFHEKKLDVSEFMRDPTAINALTTLEPILKTYGKKSLEYQHAKINFSPTLLFRIQALGYQNLWLVAKNGTIIFSIPSSTSINDNILSSIQYKHIKHMIEKSLITQQPHMTSLIFSREKNSFSSFFSIPLFSQEDELIGIAVTELNNGAVYHLISSYNGLDSLAQILIAVKIHHQLFVIYPYPNRKNTSEPVELDSPFGQFIQKTLENSTMTSSEDIPIYQQQSLLVGKQFKKSDNWALITVVNESKLLAPIHQLSSLFLGLIGVTAFAVVCAASHVAKKIAAPILILTQKTKILSEGDLSQRIAIHSQDEIGKLGESFNTMAAKLHHLIHHLDSLVEKRTQEYEDQNIKLEQTIKELRQTRDRLITQEKLASLGALTAGIAHEIKNPLNFITNFAELSLQLQSDIEEYLKALKAKGLFSENDQKELWENLDTLKLNISKIFEHGKRADSIIYNMLQHSRGTPGEKRAINLNKLLDDYIALAYHGMRAHDSTFNVTIEKKYDLSMGLISVVPQEMSRVFLNLLNNAYYSVHQKKKLSSTPLSYQPTVKISTEHELDVVIIKIWDNGLGIASEVFPKLFTPFFSTKPPGEGTGLGLSLSYNIIVQGHGGTLSATSQLGEFTEFKITLPYH